MLKKISGHLLYGAKIKTQCSLGLPIKPRWVDFEVTELCNSRCKHCNIWNRPKKNDDLTLEQIRNAFSDPFMDDMRYIIITGGEPTLRKDLEEIYTTLHSCCPKATLQLSTNGINSKRVIDVAKFVLEKGINFDIGISLDGVGCDHDDMRGIKGNFEMVDKLLDSLSELRRQYPKLNYCIGATVSDITADKIPRLVKYADQKKVHLEYAYYQRTPYYSNESQEIHLTKNKVMDIIKSMPDAPRKEMWLKELNGKPIKFDCFALRNFFVLKSNGDVVPCLTYSNVVAGNIKEKGFKQIFISYNAKTIRQKTVKACPGCLNTWAYSWSAASKVTPFISYYLRHPKAFFEEAGRK